MGMRPPRGLCGSNFNHILVVTHSPDMPDCLSSNICLPLVGRLGQRAPEPTRKIPHSPIHSLNDDVLLNIFHLYQLDVSNVYDEDGDPNFEWDYQRWWYKLAQVCQWWRYLILASPSHLDLHLLCTHGVPIADMLAHSPPLPLTINYRETTEEDEKDILLALRHSDRVHYIRLNLSTPKLRKIITTMDEQFPILERMYIRPWIDGSLVLPRTFQAPHLRHLFLRSAALPIGSPLLTTTVGFVTLRLEDIPSSAYFSPSYLLTRLSLMPQLAFLSIRFRSPLPTGDVESQMFDIPIMTPITLPNLHRFSFQGVSTYLEGLLARISAPALIYLDIVLLTFVVPRVLQFVGTSETLHLTAVRLNLGDHEFILRSDESMVPFCLKVQCIDFDRQVSSTVQSLAALQPVLSGVERLVLSHGWRCQSWHNLVDRTLWRELLRPFGNLKTLHVHDSFVGKLARSLQTDDGEPPLELLPKLEEVGYSGGDDARDAFTPFIDERQIAGHPVNLTMVDISEFWRWMPP
ncbi:hypothetical protein BJV78DRAFT_909918 [Lactifluus subvellereus]|nr:hypothetical protein BJV78DRAFT_909918 [Lactifluus subvellereus]